MRTLLLTLGGAVAALAVAAPSSAEAAGQPYPYGYGAPNYGYNTYGAANLQTRIAGVRQQIRVLAQQRLLSPSQARRLFNETRQLDMQIRRQAYVPTNPYRLQQLQVRVARLEQRVRYAASRASRYGYPGYGNGYGYNGYNPYGYSPYGNNGYYGRGERGDDRRDRNDDHQGNDENDD